MRGRSNKYANKKGEDGTSRTSEQSELEFSDEDDHLSLLSDISAGSEEKGQPPPSVSQRDGIASPGSKQTPEEINRFLCKYVRL